MLSPNAMNRVRAGLGDNCTTTGNAHDADRAFESVTVHVTAVVPGAKRDPLDGLQVGPVSGAEPRATIGAPKVTIAPDPSAACTGAGGAGQEMVGPPGSVSVGCGGLLLQAAAPPASRRKTCARYSETKPCTDSSDDTIGSSATRQETPSS